MSTRQTKAINDALSPIYLSIYRPTVDIIPDIKQDIKHNIWEILGT